MLNTPVRKNILDLETVRNLKLFYTLLVILFNPSHHLASLKICTLIFDALVQVQSKLSQFISMCHRDVTSLVSFFSSMSYIYLFQIKKTPPKVQWCMEDLGTVTVTICRMAFTPLCPQKSSLGLCANPTNPHYPSGVLNWFGTYNTSKYFTCNDTISVG